MVKVSIIIPVYNAELYLRQCLDSVVNQTLTDIEAICVDDCSPDGSAKILAEYAAKDSRIKVFNMEKNSGPGAARNFGLSKAGGKYIMFLDPDDWYELNACELAYNQIEKNQNDMVFFEMRFYDNNTGKFSPANRLRGLRFQGKNSFHLYDLKFPPMNFGESVYKIYNASFLQKNKICFLEQRYCEDIPFYIKAFVCADFVSVLDIVLYNYRLSFGSDKYSMKWKELLKARKNGYDIVKKCEKKDVYMNPYIATYITSLLYWYKRHTRLNPKITKDFYTKMREVFLELNKNHNIEEIRNYIDYKTFMRIVKRPYYVQKIGDAAKKVFSVTNSKDKKHKIINIMGIKLALKKKKHDKNQKDKSEKLMGGGKEKVIYTFWEPKNKIPAYVALCMETWKKFLPDYKIVVLDYSNLEQYLGKNFYHQSLYKHYSLPKQADAIRCAILAKNGGIWFDADTIVTSSKIADFLSSSAELTLVGYHIGFIVAKKQSAILKKWTRDVKKHLYLRRKCKRWPWFALLVKKLNPDYFARLDSWDFLGNAILNKYIAKASEKEFHSIDRKQNNIIMEVAYWDEQKQEFSPNEQYVKYYFENDFSEYFLQKEQGLVMLHNSWTPDKYKSMGEDEFLQQNITIAKVLKKLL